MDLKKNMVQWQAVVNTVMDFLTLFKVGIFFIG